MMASFDDGIEGAFNQLREVAECDFDEVNNSHVKDLLSDVIAVGGGLVG